MAPRLQSPVYSGDRSPSRRWPVSPAQWLPPELRSRSIAERYVAGLVADCAAVSTFFDESQRPGQQKSEQQKQMKGKKKRAAAGDRSQHLSPDSSYVLAPLIARQQELQESSSAAATPRLSAELLARSAAERYVAQLVLECDSAATFFEPSLLRERPTDAKRAATGGCAETCEKLGDEEGTGGSDREGDEELEREEEKLLQANSEALSNGRPIQFRKIEKKNVVFGVDDPTSRSPPKSPRKAMLVSSRDAASNSRDADKSDTAKRNISTMKRRTLCGPIGSALKISSSTSVDSANEGRSVAKRIQQARTRIAQQVGASRLAKQLNMSRDEIDHVLDVFSLHASPFTDRMQADGFEQAVQKLVMERIDDEECAMDRARLASPWHGRSNMGEWPIDFLCFLDWYNCHAFAQDLCVSAEEVELRELAKHKNIPMYGLEACKRVFDSVAGSHRAEIDKVRFQQVVRKLMQVPADVDLPLRRFEKLWMEVDSNEDGRANFEEFVSFAWRSYKGAEKGRGYLDPLMLCGRHLQKY